MQAPDVHLHRILRAALLERAGPESCSGHLRGLPVPVRTAARLVNAGAGEGFGVWVRDAGQHEHFGLDMGAALLASRSDWRWVTHLAFVHHHHTFLELPCEPRLVDLPYAARGLNARGLLAAFEGELRALLDCP